MRSLGTRRAVQVAGAATVAVIALAGCSAGQVAETANLKTPISGLNTESPDGSLLIRNLQVVYNSPEGYASGSAAPLEVSLFNQTQNPITVLISSKPSSTAGIVAAQQVGVMSPVTDVPAATAPSAAASAPASTPASAPASTPASAPASTPAAPPTPTAQPARFTIKPLSSQVFMPGDATTLQAIGLTGKLVPGGSLSLVFQIGDSQSLEVTAPFAIPNSPAARGEGVEGENSEGGE